MVRFLLKHLVLFSLAAVPLITAGQSLGTDTSASANRTVVAGEKYKAGPFHQWLWGSHYRKEWVTPVRVPVFYLDSVVGGLKPEKLGGGMQTKSLHLADSTGRKYRLRSIDKKMGNALPPLLRGTFVETIANDHVSIMHPFGALVLPPIAGAAGVFYTNISIVYVPEQESLGRSNKEFSNVLALFETLPWNDDTEPLETTELLEKLLCQQQVSGGPGGLPQSPPAGHVVGRLGPS